MASVLETPAVCPNSLTRIAAWLPVLVLPTVVVACSDDVPAWGFMWILAISIFTGFKWLSWIDSLSETSPSLSRSLGYLLLWPGMNAKSFLATSQVIKRPERLEWLACVAKTSLGLLLLAVATENIEHHPTLAAWTGMVGIVFTLHFGLLHLLSLLWRRAGVDAPPIMNAPALATSLSDFWGRRWNLAFRDLSRTYVFRPCLKQLGVAGATMAVFLISGLIHDLVISLPAGGGYGLPTLYFAIHGLGVLFVHSRAGKHFGMNRGLRGRVFGATIALAPAGLLFHPPFVERVIIPMLTTLANTGS